MTFALWEIDAGATLPEHAHHHEQVVHLYEGEFELTVEGQPVRATPGAVFAIPPNARHSGRALTACRIMDVFYPVREDYRDGAGTTIISDAAKSG
jgi:quercetin dioxygenase-like cupin family protein